MKQLIASLGIALLLSSPASASLIVNGGFSDLGGQSLSRGSSSLRWNYFSSIPGWQGINHLEIQRRNGEQFAELNAHPRQNRSFELHQSFATTIGGHYQLEFYAKKRQGRDGNFFVSVGDLVLEEIDSHLRNQWTRYSFSFTATDSQSTLGFLSGQRGNDTTGHYIDNVSVIAKVPEPGTVGLLALGFAALVGSRRRARG